MKPTITIHNTDDMFLALAEGITAKYNGRKILVKVTKDEYNNTKLITSNSTDSIVATIIQCDQVIVQENSIWAKILVSYTNADGSYTTEYIEWNDTDQQVLIEIKDNE